jgi:hypothetical protein
MTPPMAAPVPAPIAVPFCCLVYVPCDAQANKNREDKAIQSDFRIPGLLYSVISRCNQSLKTSILRNMTLKIKYKKIGCTMNPEA